MTVAEVITKIERFAPPEQAPFDYVGLLQGDVNGKVSRVGMTLDYSLQAIEKAVELGCGLLITHHGPTEINYPLGGNNLAKISLAARHGLVVYRAHLNLDFCPGGIIESLCQILSIQAKPCDLMYEGKRIRGGVYLAENYQMTFGALMERVKRLRSNCVRVAGPRKEKFRRIAVTSGQGFQSEFFDQLRPEVYIAGEFEQEAVKYAEDLGIMLLELSHHASEARPLDLVAKRLTKLLGVQVERIEIPDTIVTV